ncbi:MAG: tetratricopeptide repeat protein [Anaerolineae bacterium]|nr:tetratricopeptide repeat protein [Anaerolineae bacterium]
MTDQPERINPRLTRQDAYILVTIVAVMLAALALFVALRIDRRVELDVSDDLTTEDAESILARANEVAGFADSILSFLEGASVVVGAGLAVGAWMLRTSIQSQVEKVNEFVEQTRQQFAEREKALDQLEADLMARTEDMVTQTQERIAAVQQQGRDALRVLSLLVLAEQQIRAHNFDSAIRALQDARELDPDNQATCYLLGYLYTSRKQFDDAIEHLEQALKADANFAPAIAALGLALRRKGDAISDPDRLVERDQLWAQAENKLLEALNLDWSLTDAEGESYYGTLGGLYRRQGRDDAAIRAYERARQVTPNSSYPITNLASLYKHQGDDEQAAFFFERVLRTAELQLDDDPRDYWTRADYAQARLILGQPDDALDELRLMLEQAPERGVLETVRSGLRFLAESPTPIDGLDAMIDLLNAALDQGAGQGANDG